MSREGAVNVPRLLDSHLVKNNFRPTFIIFMRNLPKVLTSRSRKIYDKYSIKIVRDVPGRPRECPRIILQSSGEKHFSTKFHHFCAKYFSSFRNFPGTVLDTVTTDWAHTLHEHLNTHREITKNIYCQNKLATSENKPN